MPDAKTEPKYSNEPVNTGVNVPPPDPEETNRVFKELEQRNEWEVFGGGSGGPIVPPGGGRPVEKGEPNEPPEELPIGVTSEGMGSYEYAEHVADPEPEVQMCWKCGVKPGRKLPQNGSVLCPDCEGIMKP